MSLLSSFGRFCLNLLCPPVCPICHQSVDAAHCLCPKCFGKLKFITKPCCKICGRPFEYDMFDNLICGKCMEKKPRFDMARSVLIYDKFSKQLILAFKHGDHTELAPLFTKFLLFAEPEIFKNVDMILPVPLHRFRLIRRKYNQAGVLGKHLSRKTKIPFYPSVIKRVKSTQSQGHMSRTKRKRNLVGAFQIPKPDKVKGKTILLIDDVMTTGATVEECAKTLKKAGAKSVKVLTLYRVIPF